MFCLFFRPLAADISPCEVVLIRIADRQILSRTSPSPSGTRRVGIGPETVRQGRPLENLRVESCVVLVPGCTSASTYCIDVPPIGSRSSRLGGRVSNSVFYCDGRSSIHHLKLHQATRLQGRRWLRSLSTAASVNMSNGCLGDRASDFGATHSCRSATTSRSPKQAGSPLG